MKNQLKALWEITQTFGALLIGATALVLASFYTAEVELIRLSLLFIGAALVLTALAPMGWAYVISRWPEAENTRYKNARKAKII